jgi:glutathione S-transferase
MLGFQLWRPLTGGPLFQFLLWLVLDQTHSDGGTMILYTFPHAPNPLRVEIFAAEKGLQLDRVVVDIQTREQKTPQFLQRSPSGKIPVLELDDGTHIAETVAICRYIEAMHPEPNLFGGSALEIAQIEMRHRFLELELFNQVGVSWVNGPIIAATGLIEPIEAARKRSDAFVNLFYSRLDKELGARDYMAGDRFTVADITALCCIDFAATLVDLRPAAELLNVWAWHARVADRTSVKAVRQNS